jgi:hypothetical protein
MWLAFELQAGGQPAIAGVEWGGGNPRITADLVTAMEVPANSPRFLPIPKDPRIPGGYFSHAGAKITQRLDSVTLTLGTTAFWTGASDIYRTFDFGENFPGQNNVVLMDTRAEDGGAFDKRALFISTSSGQVCVNE